MTDSMRSPGAVRSSLIAALLASLVAPFGASCAVATQNLDAGPFAVGRALSTFNDAADGDESGSLDGLDNVVIDLTVTARNSDFSGDEVFGLGIYSYPEDSFGLGLQFQGTVRGTDPELEVVLTPPTGELEPRNREFTIDLVVTRRLSPTLGAFAGVGFVTAERYRRFLDAVGNDFFVRSNRDYRANGTFGIHAMLGETLVLTAQYDTFFEAATFGIGIQL